MLRLFLLFLLLVPLLSVAQTPQELLCRTWKVDSIQFNNLNSVELRNLVRFRIIKSDTIDTTDVDQLNVLEFLVDNRLNNLYTIFDGMRMAFSGTGEYQFSHLYKDDMEKGSWVLDVESRTLVVDPYLGKNDTFDIVHINTTCLELRNQREENFMTLFLSRADQNSQRVSDSLRHSVD